MVHAMKVVLFDIDGTLITSGGAGLRALARAFEEQFGVSNAFARVPVSGRLDPLIIRDCLDAAGLDEPADGWLDTFRATYFGYLRDELKTSPRQRVLPGVESLLGALGERNSAGVGLLTGNFAGSARIKLEHFAIASYFDWGAFGEDGPTRRALVPVALTRAAERGWRPSRPSDVLVIGDTPLDVDCAHAHGATALAVATGVHARDELDATGAEIVVDSLEDMAPVLRWLGA
ncbi:MAG: HAD family hydrolase [Vicinamibacterales bacterium]